MTKHVMIVLLESVPGLGETGDLRSVTFGYAKNFLLAKKLATLATPQAIQTAKQTTAAQSRDVERRRDDAASLKKRLNETRVVIPIRVNEKGEPFGSAGVAEIQKRLTAAGVTVPESSIHLKAKLNATGEHRVPVRTAAGTAEITVVLEPQNGEPAQKRNR